MASGKVKWFNDKKGYGFIVQEGAQDVFVHHTNIEGGGYKTLSEGDLVTYELVATARGPKAEKVMRVQVA